MLAGGEIWRVVGGSEKGGIVVRQAKELSSPVTSNRLSTGARVRQIELDGYRLHYSRLTGTGPDSGWVSIKTAEKELLIRSEHQESGANADLKPVLSPAQPGEIHVCTWNLLAPCYHRDAAGRKEVQTPFWQPRITAQIASILDASDPDLLCLQEVWMSPTVIKIINNEAKERGYRAIFCRRTGMKLDGVAVLARTSTFEVLNYWEQEICASGNRVCLWLLLKYLAGTQNGQLMVAGCTHFTFPHDEDDPQRLVQAMKAKKGCYAFAEKHGLDAQFAPLILAGDLNCSASANDDEVVDVFREEGWRSAFMDAHGKEAVATHRTHRHNHAGADLVLMRGPVKTAHAVLLPDDEPDSAFMPRPELGGAFGLNAPKTLQEWCQFSDHRPLVTKLSIGSTQP